VESIKKVKKVHKSGKVMSLSKKHSAKDHELTLDSVMDEVVQFAKKGPNQYLREAIPYDLGKVFVNGQAEVNKCSDINSQFLCHTSQEKYKLDCAGWSGTACLDKKDAHCKNFVTEAVCRSSKQKLGVECAGWGGSSCLPKGASSLLITSSGICARSESALGIPSGGWSGTSCVPAGTMTCSSITRPGVCNDAAARLSLDCAGWSGNKCFASGEPKCTEVTGQSICKTSMAKFGINCVWNGDSCFPDGGSNSSMQQKA